MAEADTKEKLIPIPVRIFAHQRNFAESHGKRFDRKLSQELRYLIRRGIEAVRKEEGTDV